MSSSCAWFPAELFQPRRYRPGGIGNWSGHLPFARDLVEAVTPSCLVELGTHLGESYFGFCQAIAEAEAPSVAYAIDTWVGEPHSGFYDNTVYEEVSAYNQANYASFSYLLRSLFDDALQKFADESIDILHIDGLHTFEAVSRDFYSWFPKVRQGGIVLLHDICVRHLDFGVWRVWENLKAEGKTFEFRHSWGLGVFRKPGSGAAESGLLKALFEGDGELQNRIRRYYNSAANQLDANYQADVALKNGMAARSPRIQVYLPSGEAYEESNSRAVAVRTNQWECVTIDIPEGVAGGSIRLDLTEQQSVIDLRGIELVSAVDQKCLWSSNGSELSLLKVGGTLIPIGCNADNSTFRYFSYGNDPQIYLPAAAEVLDQPIVLRIWLRLQEDLSALLPIFNGLTKPAFGKPERTDALGRQITALREEVEQEGAAAADLKKQLEATEANVTTIRVSVETELNALREEIKGERSAAEGIRSRLEATEADFRNSQLEQENLAQDINRKQTRLYLLEDLQRALKQENAHLGERFLNLESSYSELRGTYESLKTSHSELEASHEQIRRKHQAVNTTLANVLQSRSWRVTAPLRRITESFKNQPAPDKL